MCSDMNQTVSWLATQTADRYYQLRNILPIGLTLSLLDGAKLAPNDLISSTFVADEEVSVRIWFFFDVRFLLLSRCHT